MLTGSRRLAAVVAVVAMLAAGCATTVAGTAQVDPAAVSSPVQNGSSSAMDTSSPTGTSSSSSSATGSLTPVRPVPPSSTARSSTSTSTPPPTTSAASTSAGTVQGLPIDDIVTALKKDPVVVDNDARAAADAGELNDLDDQVTAARKAGLNAWVVLVGHDVDTATDVTDAIAGQLGGTVIVVTKTKFAVTSKVFSKQQLQDAEDAAAKASSAAKAASILVTQFGKLNTGGKVTATTASKSTTAAGADTHLDRFQLADHSIGCAIIDGTVRCDIIVKHTYTPPKNPHPDCQGDYGSAIQMPKGQAATFICISDTVYDPSLPVLPDGGSSTVGNVMCFANGPTVTCLSLDAAHGFALSPTKFTMN